MTPGTPLITATLPLGVVIGPPSALTQGNVTVINGRRPSHACGITSCMSPRSQGTNIGKAERQTACGQPQEASSRTPTKSLPTNMDAQHWNLT